MVSVLCLLLPSVFGLKILMHLHKNMSTKDEIIYYLLLVLFSNTTCFGLIYLFKKLNLDILTYLNTYSYVVFKYVVLSLAVNIIISIIITIFIKYISFKLEVNNGEKDNKK